MGSESVCPCKAEAVRERNRMTEQSQGLYIIQLCMESDGGEISQRGAIDSDGRRKSAQRGQCMTDGWGQLTGD